MQGTSNAAAADKKSVIEKVAEKRRALGRGLESLLPGPRVVSPSSREEGATAPSNGTTSLPPTAIAPPQAGRAGTPVAPPANDGQDAGGAPAPHSLVVDLQAASPGAASGNEIQQLPIDTILDNPNQTRMSFDKEHLEELAASIAAQGVLQPIVVRPKGEGNYVLIMGERRLRAS